MASVSHLRTPAYVWHADQLQPMRDSMRGVRTVLRQLMEEQTYQRQRDAMHLASACATSTPLCTHVCCGWLLCVAI
jgi:hypothetical protein